jgi:hypothetical protein
MPSNRVSRSSTAGPALGRVIRISVGAGHHHPCAAGDFGGMTVKPLASCRLDLLRRERSHDNVAFIRVWPVVHADDYKGLAADEMKDGP